MQKFKTAIIVFLLLVVVAMAVGGYFLFLAPNAPADEIPSGAITSGDITSGENLGSGSISSGDDVSDVPEEPTEEQTLRVEIENNFLFSDDGVGMCFVIVSMDKEQVILDKMSEVGYADIELVLKDFDTTENYVWDISAGDNIELIVATEDNKKATLRILEYKVGDNFTVGFVNSDTETSYIIAFLLSGANYPGYIV